MFADLARASLRLLVALILATSGIATADADEISNAPVAVSELLRKFRISPDHVSLYVHKLSEAAPRIAFNAQVPRHPAFTIKVLTTKAGLGRWEERWIVVSLMSSPSLRTRGRKDVENALLKWVCEGAGTGKPPVRRSSTEGERRLPEFVERRVGTSTASWFLEPEPSPPEHREKVGKRTSMDKARYSYSTSVLP